MAKPRLAPRQVKRCGERHGLCLPAGRCGLDYYEASDRTRIIRTKADGDAAGSVQWQGGPGYTVPDHEASEGSSP